MTRPILCAFFLGWITYSFSLYDIGPYSVTLLLLASSALGLFSLWGNPFSTLPAMLCLAASAVLSLVVAFTNHLEMAKPTTHLIQSAIGLGVLTGTASLDLERHLLWLRRLILGLGALVLLFGLYQIVARIAQLPYAFLPITNLQLGADDGFQRGYSNIILSGNNFVRVSSVFAEPSDMGRFMLWLVAFGYPCRERLVRWLLMTVGIAGIFVSQSMSGLIGLGMLLFVMALLQRDLGRLAFAGLLSVAVLVMALQFFPYLAETVGQRTARMLFDQEDYLFQTGRIRDQFDNLQIAADAPLLGHGLASISDVAADNIIGNSFVLLLIERGAIGMALFLLPFLWYLGRLALGIGERSEAAQTAFAVLVVESYSFATFGAIYFTPVYFALGFAVSQSGHIGPFVWRANRLNWEPAPQPHLWQLARTKHPVLEELSRADHQRPSVTSRHSRRST